MKRENIVGLTIIILLLILTIATYIFRPIKSQNTKDTIFINKSDTIFIYKDTIQIHYYKQ